MTTISLTFSANGEDSCEVKVRSTSSGDPAPVEIALCEEVLSLLRTMFPIPTREETPNNN